MAIEFTPLRSEFSLISPGTYKGSIMEMGARIAPATGEEYVEIEWVLDLAGQTRSFKDWIYPQGQPSARQEISRRKLTSLCDALKIPLREGEQNSLDSGMFLQRQARVTVDVMKTKEGKERNIVKSYAAL